MGTGTTCRRPGPVVLAGAVLTAARSRRTSGGPGRRAATTLGQLGRTRIRKARERLDGNPLGARCGVAGYLPRRAPAGDGAGRAASPRPEGAEAGAPPAHGPRDGPTAAPGGVRETPGSGTSARRRRGGCFPGAGISDTQTAPRLPLRRVTLLALRTRICTKRGGPWARQGGW